MDLKFTNFKLKVGKMKPAQGFDKKASRAFQQH